jgi:putative flippase GtrA
MTASTTRRLPSLLPAALGALLIMSAVVVVGRPSVFTDTRDYMIHGARFYQALRRTFLGQKDPIPATPDQQRAWERLQWQMHFDHSNAGARSPYYGIMLYTLAHRGTLWLLTAVQSFICAWLVFLLWRSMAPSAPGWTYYTLMAALAAATSLPWITSFAMPDIFAAVLIIAATLLLLFRNDLKRWEQAGVWLLMFAAVLFHGSHSLLMLALIPVGIGLGRLLRLQPQVLKEFAGMSLAAVALAAVLSWAYAAAIQAKTGDEFRRPPFLIARVLADGPGRDYLRYSCPRGATWAICRFRNLPLDTEDHILWSADPALGVFNRSNYEDRIAMEKQELTFAIDTVIYDPVGELGAALRNWGEQLVSVWVEDPLRRPMVFIIHDYWGHTNLVNLIRNVGECGVRGELCQPKVTITQLMIFNIVVLGAALFALLWSLVQPLTWVGVQKKRTVLWDDRLKATSAATLLILAGIILNAAVCGIFAGPFARYQSRVIWLLPAVAVLLPLAMVAEAQWKRLSANAGADEMDRLWGWLQPALRNFDQAPEKLWALARARLPKGWALAADRLLARVDPAFLRFGVVGVTGFVVDTSVLYLVTQALLHLDPFTGQAIAFAAAVMVTWLLNRSWTFRAAAPRGTFRQAAVYIGVQCVGLLATFSVYSLVIILFGVPKPWLIVPLAMGAVAGLCVNFLGSKHLAFRIRRPTRAAEAVADTSAV